MFRKTFLRKTMRRRKVKIVKLRKNTKIKRGKKLQRRRVTSFIITV